MNMMKESELNKIKDLVNNLFKDDRKEDVFDE